MDDIFSHTVLLIQFHSSICYSIGLSIASRLARDGAKVMVSSRKQSNVDKAVASLQKQYGQDVISGVVCHVGNGDDRKQLIKEVRQSKCILTQSHN